MNRAKKILNIFSEAIYSIGSGGMKKIGDEKILIQPNTYYYMGASSSPDLIFVTKVDDKYITYSKYPYEKEFKIETVIGKSLIDQAVRTEMSSDFLKKYQPKEYEKYKKLLNGESVPNDGSFEDQKRIEVLVISTQGNKDLWYDAEEYGNVGGIDNREFLINKVGIPKKLLDEYPEGEIYHISSINKNTIEKELKKDNRFKILRVFDRGEFDKYWD